MILDDGTCKQILEKVEENGGLTHHVWDMCDPLELIADIVHTADRLRGIKMINNCKDCEIARPCSCKGMDFKACGYFVNSGKEAALQALHDENERLGLYRDAYYDLLECVHNAVKAGDWIVDGACDPEKHLSNYKPKKEEF